jgi:hypothetical protein
MYLFFLSHFTKHPHSYGAPDTIRTCDPQIRSLVLYPAELRALNGLVYSIVKEKDNLRKSSQIVLTTRTISGTILTDVADDGNGLCDIVDGSTDASKESLAVCDSKGFAV